MDVNKNEQRIFEGLELNYIPGDEDDLSMDGSPEKPNYFDLIVGQLEDILIDQRFQQLQQDFLNKYCHEFDDSEENKLSYTGIFEEYVCTIERTIEEKLKLTVPNFDMDWFLMELQKNKGSLDGEVFEMLYTLSDFVAFKSLVLDFKAEKEGRNPDFANAFTVVPLRL
ncbi:ADP-ribosylation factor-like 2 Hypothetical protein protein [Nesidiocoris tenuis]|uniref:ADP-ribosylation factor-like protein 2-binding protein n=1 Tax=Nesidiocoris tenuis TaxID=355587 RepID=A0ABN7ABA5_9HEMI|nr:ADP-ribosylation factor-like 2 Hypothetical protein protein [Nesidiocoris tenuis]